MCSSDLSKAAARMAEQFESRQIRKTYLAVAEGCPDPADGELHDWLLKLPEQSRAEVVAADVPGARECHLSYRVLASHGSQTLLEVEPHTGRMHQIRVQLASRGWPILGDTVYGSVAHCPVAHTSHVCPTAASAEPREHSIALHAQSLKFLHPIRYDPIVVSAPLPSHWPSWCSSV